MRPGDDSRGGVGSEKILFKTKKMIIHGDSLDYMKTLPDKSIDLVLTD